MWGQQGIMWILPFYFSLSQAKLAAECLRDTVLSDQRAVEESSNSVSGILSSCLHSTLRSKNLLELLEDIEQYTVYKFNPRLESLMTSFHHIYSSTWIQQAKSRVVFDSVWTLSSGRYQGLELFCNLIGHLNDLRLVSKLGCNIPDIYLWSHGMTWSQDHKAFSTIAYPCIF